MSLTIAAARLNVRLNLGDDNTAGGLVIKNEALTRILVRHAQLYRALNPEESATTVAISNTGSNSFALTSGVTVDMIHSVTRRSDGIPVDPIPREEFDAMTIGTNSGTGPPMWYALREVAGVATNLLLWPRPITADTLDIALKSTAAAAYSDATTLEGSEYLMRAIEMATAIEAFARMTQANRDKLGLSPDVVAVWAQSRDAALRREAERKGHLLDASHIYCQVVD